MFGPNSRLPALLALVGSLIGLTFATYSTLDYATHLDRQLHNVHCSFIPGMPPTSEAEACRAAMYSPYSALFKEDYWGGLPISLPALGAFSFFVGFALYLLIAGGRAPAVAVRFMAFVGVTPLLVSLLMFTLSVTKLGSVCKTCAGIYIGSLVLATGALLGLLTLRPQPVVDAGPPPRRRLSPAFGAVWLAALGVCTLVPSVVYANSVPDERPYLNRCGQIKRAATAKDALIPIRGARAIQKVTLFEDPLCPICKDFHERLVTEGIYERMDVELALFPLDSECNWMLDRALHPGACIVAKAVICGGERAPTVLNWAYEDQEYLTRAGKAGDATLRTVIQQKWGADMLKCIDDNKTKETLNSQLHFAVDNNIAVSTPQVFIGKQRMCDEDTDIGLRYALKQLAPELLK